VGAGNKSVTGFTDALPEMRVYALLTEEAPPLLLTVNVDYSAVWVIATVAIAELLKNIFYEPIVLKIFSRQDQGEPTHPGKLPATRTGYLKFYHQFLPGPGQQR
jgi:hypothetical protein